MKKVLFFWFLVFQLVVCKETFAQNRFQKKLDKIDRKYQAGKLNRAYNMNESLIRSMLKTGKKDFEHAAVAFLYQGKILLGMGRQFDYEKSLQEAAGIVKRVYNDTGRVAYETYLGTAETYYYYGNYRKAMEALNMANASFSKSKSKELGFGPNQLLLLARINAKLGYLNKADSLTNAVMPLLQARIVKSEKGVDAKGKVKNIKLSSAEYKARRQAYAWATTLRGDIALERGVYSMADSLYKISNKWVDHNLAQKNPVKMNNYESIATIEESKGNLRKAMVYDAAALSAVKNRKDFFYFHAFEKMIYGKIIKDNFASTPHKSLATLQRKTGMYFNRENIFRGNEMLLDEWFTARKYDHNNVKDRLHEMMAEGRYIPQYSPSRIRAQEIFFLLDIRSGWNKLAEDTLLSILKVAKELYGDQSPAYHKRKLDLADFYLKRTNNLKKAEDIYIESFVGVVAKEMSPQHPKYVWYLNDIANVYSLSENYNKAVEYLQVAEKQAKTNFGATDPKYAVVLGNLANVYLGLGRYTEAKQMFQQAEKVLDNGDRDDYTPTYALVYQNIAEGYSIYGLFDQSKRCLNVAEKIMDKCAKKGYKIAESSSPDDLAAYYLRTGKYHDAEKILKQSIIDKERAKGKNATELIKPLNLLGKLYYTTGDYGQSEMQLNRAVKISTTYSGDTTLRYAESLKTLRKLHAAFGDYERAEKDCKKQIAITTRILGRDNVNVADALSDLAIVRFNLGASAKESRAMLIESNNILLKQLGFDNPYYINGMKTLAFFQMETNQFTSADSLITASEKYWDKKLGKDNIYTPELDLMRGDYYRKLGKYDLALDKYKDALSLFKSKFSTQHPDYVKTLSRIAKTYYAKADYKNSLATLNIATLGYFDFIAKYFPVLSFGEKSKYWDITKGDFEFFNSLALKMKDQNADLIGQMYDNILSTKALLLSNSIKVRQRILKSENVELIEKFNKWNDKKEVYTKTLAYSAEDLKKDNIDPVKLEKEIGDLEKELSKSSEEFAQGFESKVFHWKDVRKSLKDKEAAIEIIRFRYYTNTFSDSVIYAALIVTKETSGNPDLVILSNGKQMEKKYIKYYRNTIKFKSEDNLSYDVFWKPIEAKLKNINTIYLSSDGVYNQINVETLEDQDSKYVIDRYNIILVSNTKDLPLNAIYEKKNIKKVRRDNISLIGNPQFYSDNSTVTTRTIPQLDGAEKEARGISNLFTTNKWKNYLMTDEQADEEKLKSMDGSRVLHVATHGYFQPDQLSGQDDNSVLKKNEVNALFRSGILLSGAGDILDNNFTVGNVNSQNGILTAYEAMNMNLDNTELVTLSACETGLGDIQIGEGVAGLQRAFLVAGADNIVMSLFKVNDEITEQLMLTFYKKWLQSGDKRKAFIEAKKEIKVLHPESIYWGSFIMVGIN